MYRVLKGIRIYTNKQNLPHKIFLRQLKEKTRKKHLESCLATVTPKRKGVNGYMFCKVKKEAQNYGNN